MLIYLAVLQSENRNLQSQIDALAKAALLEGATISGIKLSEDFSVWQCDYCEGNRDGDADVKIAGDLSDCAPGTGCALWFVTDGGKAFTTSCPKCSEKN